MTSQAELPGGPSNRHILSTLAAVLALALGLTGLVVCVIGAVMQALPRQFSTAQQQAIMNWQIAGRWRQLPAGSIFPARISYQPSSTMQNLVSLDGGSLRLSARRVGIAPQTACTSGLDAAAARVLLAGGCAALLRATYADSTDSYVVTVGVAVLPGASQAHAARARLPGQSSAAGRGAGVETVGFAGTSATLFTNTRRQLSASAAAGPYVVLYVVGYADARPALPVASDQYTTAEMTSLAQGVAGAVTTALAAEPPVPHCPGAPGC